MRDAFSIMGHTAEQSFGQTVSTLVARVRDGMERRRVERAQQRQLMRELSSMTDRDLADLGLGRSDIAGMVQSLRLH